MEPIAVTGIGFVTPLGNDEQPFWDSLIEGRGKFSTIPYFNATPFRAHLAGVVPSNPFFDKLPFEDRCSRYMAVALNSCLSNARLDLADEVGLVVGTTSAGQTGLEQAFKDYLATGALESPQNWQSQMTASCVIEDLTRLYPLRGPSSIICTACASGATAIGYACDLLTSGEGSIVLAGGVDTLTEAAYYGLNSLRMLSGNGCKPFHARRRGIQLSEGACVLALETEEHALRRGVHVRALITGYGASNNATHLAHPDAVGIQMAIERALEDASISKEIISYVNAHGSGTTASDEKEIEALRSVFGSHLASVRISSIKSTLGHMQAAAGAIEAAATVLALEKGQIPPTSGLDEPDPKWIDLDLVPAACMELNLRYALSVSIGLGGDNACIVFKKAGINE